MVIDREQFVEGVLAMLRDLDALVAHRPGYDEVANYWRHASPYVKECILLLDTGREGQGPCWT